MKPHELDNFSARRALLAGAAGLGAWGLASSLSAVDPPKDEAPKIPKPEEITLTTKDQVLLKATYFGSTEGKKAPAVILVHGWGGQRGEWDGMALGLQKSGFAVVTVDLRGHGGSTRQKDLAKDSEITLDYKKMTKENDIAAMWALDMEAVKTYLIERNNAEELNVEALAVVGAEFGSLVAVAWAIQDWSWPQLPSVKQGQDVKAIALLSPIDRQGPVAFPVAAKWGPVTQLSTLIAAGKTDVSAFGRAKKIHTPLEKFHFKPTNDPMKRAEELTKMDLFLVTPETKLQGTKLLDPTLTVPAAIVQFLQLRLTKRIDKFTWTKREALAS